MRYSKRLISAAITSLVVTYSHAQTSDPVDPFEALDQLMDQQFEQTDAAIDEQFERVNRAIARAYEGLTEKIQMDWQEDIKVPTAKEWVTYSQDMQSRVAVNFESGVYVAEVLVQNNDVDNSIVQLAAMMQELQQARDEELNKKDTFLNELDKELQKENIIDSAPIDAIPVNEPSTPLLEQVVAIPDQEALVAAVAAKVAEPATPNKERETPPSDKLPQPAEPPPAAVPIKTTTTAELVQTTPPPASIAPSPSNVVIEKDTTGEVKKVKIEIRFVNNYQEKILTRYLSDIKRISKDFDIDVSTMLAIMETESSFNPRATSPIPAFGLMQVVPRTAGVDAYRHVYGEKKVVSADFLYDEINNILMGTAYFNILDKRYLKRIENGQSRFYCAVASYNTGVGNLARTFTGKKDIKAAARYINTLEPQQVYDHLIDNLPAEETKNYLRKITKRAEKYKQIDWDRI